MEKEEQNSSKKVLLMVLAIALLVVAVVGVSFAAYTYSRRGEKVNSVTIGSITMSYTDQNNGIEITNAYPMSDETGKSLAGENEYFDFIVSALISSNQVGSATINYVIAASEEDNNTLPNTAIKLYLTSGDSESQISTTEELTPTLVSNLSKTTASDESGAPSDQYVLKRGTISSNYNKYYRLRMWIADTYTGTPGVGFTEGDTFKIRVNVYGQAVTQ